MKILIILKNVWETERIQRRARSPEPLQAWGSTRSYLLRDCLWCNWVYANSSRRLGTNSARTWQDNWWKIWRGWTHPFCQKSLQLNSKSRLLKRRQTRRKTKNERKRWNGSRWIPVVIKIQVWLHKRPVLLNIEHKLEFRRIRPIYQWAKASCQPNKRHQAFW